MGYEIVSAPFLLMETVAMLHKFVNGIAFQSAISRQRFFMNDPAYLAKSQKMSHLQAIMEELCAGLDVQDPPLFCQRRGRPGERVPRPADDPSLLHPPASAAAGECGGDLRRLAGSQAPGILAHFPERGEHGLRLHQRPRLPR